MPGQGQGRGQGGGRGQGPGVMGTGRGRGGGSALGPGGLCGCPKCGYEQTHQLGIPCYEQKCPECGSPMIRLR